MFEMHLGDGLTLKPSTVKSPLLILGEAGQGKTVLLLQLVLELIRNNQHGLIYDPYGDLAKDIDHHVQSEKMRARTSLTSEGLYVEGGISTHDKDRFTIVSGDIIKNGAIATRASAQKVITQALKELQHNDWLIIDEASDFLTDDIFEAYLNDKGPRLVLSDQSLIRYSSIQRCQLLQSTTQIALYKTRNIDGKFIEQAIGSPNAKQIAAIKQYHYYWINGIEQKYTNSPWPIEMI